jgi:hypothetical protein
VSRAPSLLADQRNAAFRIATSLAPLLLITTMARCVRARNAIAPAPKASLGQAGRLAHGFVAPSHFLQHLGDCGRDDAMRAGMLGMPWRNA